MDDVLLESLDRLAFGFAEAKGRHWLRIAPFELLWWTPIWAAIAVVTSAALAPLRDGRGPC